MVLPLAEIGEPTDDETIDFKAFLGTAFVVGSGRLALTAAHVLPEESSNICLMRISDDLTWRTVPVRGWERHPTEDVALVHLGQVSQPAFSLSEAFFGQGGRYHQFGYPKSVLHETDPEPHTGAVLPRPDLAYFTGYVRRRLSGIEIPMIPGRNFFELSEVSGPGTSGSPLMDLARSDAVVGIYVGERVTEEDPPRRLAFAARLDAIVDWRPESLGGATLLEGASA